MCHFLSFCTFSWHVFYCLFFLFDCLFYCLALFMSWFYINEQLEKFAILWMRSKSEWSEWSPLEIHCAFIVAKPELPKASGWIRSLKTSPLLFYCHYVCLLFLSHPASFLSWSFFISCIHLIAITYTAEVLLSFGFCLFLFRLVW